VLGVKCQITGDVSARPLNNGCIEGYYPIGLHLLPTAMHGPASQARSEVQGGESRTIQGGGLGP